MTRYCRAASALWRAVPGHLLLSDAHGEVVDVTGSGALVWELLAAPMEASDLVVEVGRLYGEDASAVETPVRALLADLVARGFVEVTS